MATITEVDLLEITVLVDNELDPMSPSPRADVITPLPMRGIALAPLQGGERGGAPAELRMDNICCAAHGLSLMITATKGDEKHTLLFDAGPEGAVWERNATRLRAKIGDIEHVHLSHWHRDHSGGLEKAISMIKAAGGSVTADLHPDRPDFRGLLPPGAPAPISLEADPTFEELEKAGAKIVKSAEPHTVLGGMFMVSGAIPRKTAYEEGLRGAMSYSNSTDTWEKDELIMDERMVICNLKGK
jgi:7,8-dihydropterin-6-yl-methyl-4-(beta-D-ribofuranosyl)aminobenzene 5'-phosphate synthase